MNTLEVENRVREIAAEVYGIEPSAVNIDEPAAKLFGVKGFEAYESLGLIAVKAEKEFEVGIPDDIYKDFDTLRDMIDFFLSVQPREQSWTIGERMVRARFNPSEDSTVDQIQQKTAELINLAHSLREKDPRLAHLAMTHYETAAMWAVKTATAEGPAALPA